MEVSVSTNNVDKKSYYVNSAAGIVSGATTMVCLPNIIKKPFGKFFIKQVNSLSQPDNIMFWNAANKAYVESFLPVKGIQMVDINDSNLRTVVNKLIERRNQFFDKNKHNPLKKMIMKITLPSNKKIKSKIDVVANGRNACFIPGTNQVLVNSKKIGIAAFHELGHAININGKGFKHFLAKSRAASLLAIPIFGIGLLAPKRKGDDEYKNSVGKAATFIKNHCGLLCGLSFLPVIMEEGMASINGAKLAKKGLNKKMLNKLNIFNAKALSTYIFSAAALGACASFSVYIKDRIAGIKPE